MKKIIFITLFFIIIPTLYANLKNDYFLEKYSDITDKIIAASTKDSTSWQRLAYLCDVYGPRLSGSDNLENALNWIESEMKKDNLVNVRKESVMVPNWRRNFEKCEMLYPRIADIPVLGLGGSINTPKDGITAEVIVFKNFDELEANKDKVKGKIVVYNQSFLNYGQSVQYRTHGASRASKYGAVASLIHAVSPNASRNLHTGMMVYNDSVPKIPNATISPEDAMLLNRLQDYGITPKIKLIMNAETLADRESSNIMAEIIGTEFPDEIIAIGGHIDSWDVGTGAQDDASGCIATWMAVKLLKDLNIKPKRTIRVVFWVNEENGVRGGKAYYEAHKKEKHSLMFEMDGGAFTPLSIRYTGPDSIYDDLKKIEPLLKRIAPMTVEQHGGGVDIGPMMRDGINGMSLQTDDKGKYFYYHHSHSDTADKVDALELNQCVASIALSILIYADFSSDIVKSGNN